MRIARSLASMRKAIARKESNENPESLTPYSSAPFVSGDTFRGMAGIEILDNDFREYPGLNRNLVFATCDVARQPNFVRRASDLVKDPHQAILVLHNGDIPPTESRIRQCAKVFKSVFCVNLVEESSNTFAIPIGLENVRRWNNGRLSYYFRNLQVADKAERQRMVLSSFNVSTNPDVRKPARGLFESSRFGFDGHQWGRKEFRVQLTKTYFVISPPGNGNDCHRTWEAIYSGAVPVVLEGTLAPSLTRNMPILTVPSFEHFLGFSDRELMERFHSLKALSPQKAFSHYWATRLLGEVT